MGESCPCPLFYKFGAVCDDLIFPEESTIPPIISPKKSLASWIQKVAIRGGVDLWEKPFQNCRSSRDTELRKMFPEYLVNRWIGHTQQVAEDHYIQNLKNDFIDACTAEKNRAKMGVEPAGIGCFGIEIGNSVTAASPCISTICNDIPNGEISSSRQGLEPCLESPVNCSTKRQSGKVQVQEFAQVKFFPADLRQVIDHWESLPSEVKQTILTLVKHSRRRKKAVVS